METTKISFTDFGQDIAAKTQRRKRVLENQECEICGDRSTGKHYGVFSCDGCSGFFKRTCHRSEPFLCKGHGDCTVDKSSRNDCKACRLRKCLRTGMNVDACGVLPNLCCYPRGVPVKKAACRLLTGHNAIVSAR